MSSKTTSILIVVLVLHSFVRCSVKSDTMATQLSPGMEIETMSAQPPEQLERNCYICHNPNAVSHDAILAPPLPVVRKRYNGRYSTREAFVENMTAFLINPTNEKAIMSGAVDRFGIMAKTVLDEKTIREIVEYIYDNKLEEPTWLKDEMGKQGMH